MWVHDHKRSVAYHKVIMVCDTLPYGHASTYQISLTYLERNNYLTMRSKVKVQQRTVLPSYLLFILKKGVKLGELWCLMPLLTIFQLYHGYLKRNIYLTLRSKSNKGHYGMRHTALWSCIHIPNIIARSNNCFINSIFLFGP
jgi:hypothetical protein